MADCFLVEVYTPAAATGFTGAVARVRAAARAMMCEGVDVRYRRALLVHEDDTCFHVLEAPSAEAVIEASKRAGLEFERIVEVVEMAGSSDGGEDRGGASCDSSPQESSSAAAESLVAPFERGT